MKKQNFDELLNEAVKNIREDRDNTKQLLADLQAWMVGTGNNNSPGSSDRHKDVGFTLAKYVETLQRSNEQLVKIAQLTKKKDDEKEEFTDEDRNNIFDQLNSAVPTIVKEKKAKK
jgi:hypothetical protein